jgi:hypothetical protein
VQRILVRRLWPEVRIVLRSDGGFCRDHIMSCCRSRADYCPDAGSVIYGQSAHRNLRKSTAIHAKMPFPQVGGRYAGQQKEPLEDC